MASAIADPLADLPAGPCTRCDHGWVTVGEGYVEAHAELPASAKVSDEDREVLLAARRQALRDTIYPCKTCRPSAFFRWAKGCWEQGHNRASCDLCTQDERPTIRRKSRR